MSRRLLPGLLLALLLTLPLSVPAHPGDGRPHVQSFQELRNVNVVTSVGSLEYQLDRRTQPTVDAIRVRFDAASASVTFDYRKDEADRASGTRATLTLVALVEYRDVDGNGAFDRGTDYAERTHEPSKFTWTVTKPTDVYRRGHQGKYTVAQGVFEGASALSLEFIATGNATDVGTARLHPQDVKMTWNVARFPFTKPDTAVALVTRLDVPTGFDWREERTSQNALVAALLWTPDRFLFFDWAPTALANSSGEVAADKIVIARMDDAGASSGKGREARDIVFSYPRSDFLISHDPSFGIEYVHAKAPILPIKWFVLGGLVAVVAGAGVLAKRRGWLAQAAVWAAAERVALVARWRAWRAGDEDDDEPAFSRAR